MPQKNPLFDKFTYCKSSFELQTVPIFFNLSREDDSNNESIDCDSLAEDDRDQVLGLDPWGFDTSAYDGSSGGVDSHSGSDHTEIESEVVENTINRSP